MTSATIAAFNRIQNNEFTEPVTLSTSIKSINNSLHELLGFTAGYYGSIIKLTGNVTYAKEKTNSYFVSGLDTVAHSDINSGISLKLKQVSVSTNWFGKEGFTHANLTVDYDIPTLGLSGVTYLGSASLNVTILETVGDQCKAKVLGDNNEPNLSLTKDNFSFFKFDRVKYAWTYLDPTIDPTITNSGIYSIKLPSGINADAYYLQVTDQRGIIVSSSYVRGVGNSNKDQACYTYTFAWDNLYNSLNDQNMEIELLQNGTLRWLGQALPFSGTEKPIPPIPVKGLRLNETVSGVNEEVPFQVEDWGSSYQVPFGMTSNTTIFNENCMIVFLINHDVTKATLWWDGSDEAIQTPYAYKNVYFTNDDPTGKKLDNGKITLDLSHFSGDNGYVRSTTKTSIITSDTTFLRINSETPTYGSDPSYTIHHGVVRDIIQQEPEWSGGVASSPDFYGHVVLTLPANTNYYTYKARVIYVPTTRTRDLSELSAIQVKAPTGNYSQRTEDGTQAGKPLTSPSTLLYDGGIAHQHQWSEYIGTDNKGAGLIMRSSFNERLYTFDEAVGQHTGSISIDTTNKIIELNPIDIERFAYNEFHQGVDVSWIGAIINFGSGNAVDSIYPPPSGGDIGLWILVEYPPIVSIS
jgi:hypothetical protein